MHDDLRHQPLTFPSLPLGKNQTPPDLQRLLYKGGASLVRMDQADQAIRQGMLGDVVPERVELVHRVHEFIAGALAGGGSASTARAQITYVVSFFGWAEKAGATLSISEVQKTYLDWTEHLLHRARVVKDLKQNSAHYVAVRVGAILDGVLARPTPMVELTRTRRTQGRKSPMGAQADKQNLHETFVFGRLLQDICDGLPLAVIWGPRRVSVPLQGGGELKVSGQGRPARPEEERKPKHVRESAKRDLAYENDRALDHPVRRTLVNQRIQAELLVFIGQTGMNLSQAQGLALRHFSYASDIDGYKVREYKSRRQGEVLFEVYSEYRSHFERYLAWRRELFPESKQLFPLIRQGAHEKSACRFEAIQAACKNAGVPWVGPRTLRGTRVNWLLRRSGDPDLTAEMAQHSKQTLLRVYEVPSQQRAIGEITRFWQANDPSLAGATPSLAVAPGDCDGTPVASAAKPKSAPEPDCRRPSGCLWCEHHRDIDSFDYVWSLACFRHLKGLEKSKHCPPSKQRNAPHPADHVMQRLGEKLSWFNGSNDQRREWVEEALARVEEGDYHEQWVYLIKPMEGPSE